MGQMNIMNIFKKRKKNASPNCLNLFSIIFYVRMRIENTFVGYNREHPIVMFSIDETIIIIWSM